MWNGDKFSCVHKAGKRILVTNGAGVKIIYKNQSEQMLQNSKTAMEFVATNFRRIQS